MRSYTLLFMKQNESVPSLDFMLFETDGEAVDRAPQLARDRTDCFAVEIWHGERLVDRLVCLEPRTWAPSMVSERGSRGGWEL